MKITLGVAGKVAAHMGFMAITNSLYKIFSLLISIHLFILLSYRANCNLVSVVKFVKNMIVMLDVNLMKRYIRVLCLLVLLYKCGQMSRASWKIVYFKVSMFLKAEG